MPSILQPPFSKLLLRRALGVFWGLLTLLPLTIIWRLTTSPNSKFDFSAWTFSALLLAFLLLPTLILRSLRGLLPRRRIKPLLRLSFFLSLGYGWLLSTSAVILPGPLHPLMLAGLSFLGSFGGALLATALHSRLWENNHPPSAEILSTVSGAHQLRIGTRTRFLPAKRSFDILLAAAGLLLSLPVWLLIALLTWIEDPGPLFFAKNVVGKGGGNFRQWKFRTMIQNAERQTGPIVSSRSDKRVLRVGRIFRRSAMDELPQLINILLGQMSFVGPRPQRTVLVHGILETLAAHVERHRVAPGLSGLAQVAGRRYLTPAQKLRYDRVYVDNAGLLFDLKLLVLAFIIVFYMRWKPGWEGPIPRAWLRFGTRRHRSRQSLPQTHS